MTQMSLTRAYLLPQWPAIFFASLCALLLGIVGAGVGLLMGPAIRILSEPSDTVIDIAVELGPRWVALTDYLGIETAYTCGALLAIVPVSLIILSAFRSGLGLGQWFLWEYAAETAALHLRGDLMRRFLHLSPVKRLTKNGRKQEEELSATISTDIKMLREYYVHYYGGLPRELIQVVWFTIVLLMLSPMLTGIFFLGVIPGLAVIQSIGRKVRRRASRALSDSSSLTEWLQQRLSGIETIKHYGTENQEVANLQSLTSDVYKRFFAAARTKARTGPLLESISIVALVFVLVIAFAQIASGEAPGAAMLSFFTSVALLGQSAGKLGRYYNANREGMAALDRIQERFSFFSDVAQDRASKRSVGDNRLVIDNVSFCYPSADQPAVAGLSYTFVPGKVYCIVGASGSGKSTLLRLILGLLEPESGQIAWPKSDRRDAIAYMPQAVKLADTSIAANIAFPHADIDRERVTKALDVVDMTSLVAELPDGIDTLVGHEGRGLSGGQAQRVLLARLWYHDADLVVIDEGTSALDPEVEQRVVKLVKELAKNGAIVVMVAHRQALAETSDVKITLDQGRLST